VKNILVRLKSIVRSLRLVISIEKNAIGARAYDRLIELTAQKKDLLDEFDLIAAMVETRAASDEVIHEIRTLRARANDNALLLSSMMKGLSDARARIESMNQINVKSGLYDRDGASIKPAASASIAKKA